MPCFTQALPQQTLSERKEEVRKAIANLNTLLIARKIKPFIGPQGAIAFPGWTGAGRGRVSDVCAYRLIMSTGSALAKAEISKAETMAGRAVSKAVIGAGVHSHDNGHTWHGKD